MIKYRDIDGLSDSLVKSRMLEYNNKCDEVQKVEEKVKELKTSMNVMESYISFADRGKINSIIDSYSELVLELKHEVNLLRDNIESMQRGCDHQMVNVAHDSHYDYYRCSKCGYEDRW